VGLLPDTRWHSFEIRLNPGDMIVSFRDGVLDLYDGTLTAIDGIALLATATTSATDIVDAVQKRAVGTNNPDDVTILAVRRTAQQPAPLGRREGIQLTPAPHQLAEEQSTT
jgi:sigma-B regulation protein RsbU (phosphoserine phosphatase)